MRACVCVCVCVCLKQGEEKVRSNGGQVAEKAFRGAYLEKNDI